MSHELLRSEEVRGGIILDPRTKLLLVFTTSLVLVAGGQGGAMNIIRIVLAVLPLLLLMASRRWTVSLMYAALYALTYFGELFLMRFVHGFPGFILLAFCGIFSRFMPGIMMGYFLVTTTTVSQFMAAMGRMRVSEKITIPLSVMMRFFPTLAEEYAAIKDAMRMRGIYFGGGNALKIPEYRMVPLLMSAVKIGEELSAAALTRGLGKPVQRTNLCRIGFSVKDIFLLTLCLGAFAAWLYFKSTGR